MKVRALSIALLAALLGAFAWYLWGERHTPAGQAPLARLNMVSLDTLRGEFNGHADKVRIVILLSPTWTNCLRGASAVQDVLASRPAAGVRVFTIWQPILATDLAPPLSSVLRRIPDVRTRQFWDPDHLLSAQMKKDARPPQPAPDCCERSGHLWDLAAVYPAGATWTDRMPPATVFNGPVADLIGALTAALQ